MIKESIPPEYEDPNEDHQEAINDLDEELCGPYGLILRPTNEKKKMKKEMVVEQPHILVIAYYDNVFGFAYQVLHCYMLHIHLACLCFFSHRFLISDSINLSMTLHGT